ncbi:hypothetical protein [Chelativorans sp. Marseille-P2723]|uniref:hypothetical protein n=1 Tax=Chelativorans sp. Marseille-P2723 TaxID=2709133 RepID=UPI00156EFF6D|nr:hypothetical protein [Chelativorans sp. Marseille-P2723]
MFARSFTIACLLIALIGMITASIVARADGSSFSEQVQCAEGVQASCAHYEKTMERLRAGSGNAG